MIAGTTLFIGLHLGESDNGGTRNKGGIEMGKNVPSSGERKLTDAIGRERVLLEIEDIEWHLADFSDKLTRIAELLGRLRDTVSGLWED